MELDRNSREPDEEQASIPSDSTSCVDFTKDPSKFCSKNPIQRPNPVRENLDSEEIEAEETLSSSDFTTRADVYGGASGESVEVGCSGYLPLFLKKVFDVEAENLRGCSDHRLVIFAVHAVFLESGFISCAREMKSSVSSIGYTLPSLVNPNSSSSDETVNLKFLLLGRFLTVYGCLGSKGSGLRRVAIDAVEFAPFMVSVYRSYEGNSDLGTPDRKRVFEFWRIVKDGLSTPLLIDLCNKMGLPPPSCFVALPTELKLHILEFLPGVDLATIACACSELKYLSSSDELWERKCREEFGTVLERDGCWKMTFEWCWKNKNRAEKNISMPRYPYHMRFPLSSVPSRFGFVDNEDRMLLPFWAQRRRRLNMLPHCNFGVINTIYRDRRC